MILPELNSTNVQFLCCWPLYPLPLPSHQNESAPIPLDPSQPIPFSPWRPGDAYNTNQDDWPPSPAYFGAWQYGDQIREWDHKTKRWYYHTAPKVESSVETGYTGGIIVGFLVVLLWLYSFYRLWMVWAYTLNFDGTIVQGQKGWDFLVTWVLHSITAKKRRRTLRMMKKREGLVNGDVLVEEGEWENNTTSPETDRTESAKLRFPNPAKFESDFSAIYQFEKSGYKQLIKKDPSRHNLERHSDQPKRRNPRHSLRSSSLDQSTISCYNELNRTFKSNCDFHFSTGSRSGSEIHSPQHVQEISQRTIQPIEVTTPKLQPTNCPCRSTETRASSPQYCRNGIYIVNKNSYSTDV
eukprot:TRINITY_DN35459_c0_g1_i1.p1 TRINITY_DN35459_c0_g1~~TRINITY_DN35459_c0_g1_i1.p1  ORF type:complete len:353 (-),score=60.72 TRINITY_DN35459_c0_g1_i1:56-1114(-)